jgi:hypothetical protein
MSDSSTETRVSGVACSTFVDDLTDLGLRIVSSLTGGDEGLLFRDSVLVPLEDRTASRRALSIAAPTVSACSWEEQGELLMLANVNQPPNVRSWRRGTVFAPN